MNTLKTKTAQPAPCYVMGLMFSHDLSNVALIRKLRPEWQRGKMNGIGGKVEYGESPLEAMNREFEEEAGVKTALDAWKLFLTMRGINDDQLPFLVDCFCAKGELREIKSITDEEITIVPVHSIRLVDASMIDNVPWLVGCALDMLRDGRPTLITVDY